MRRLTDDEALVIYDTIYEMRKKRAQLEAEISAHNIEVKQITKSEPMSGHLAAMKRIRAEVNELVMQEQSYLRQAGTREREPEQGELPR